MKKDNKLGKFVAFVLLITLIALILVANTYAKYTSKTDLTAQATVAKWSIKVNDKDILDQSITFDLFSTVKDTKDGNDEKDVAELRIAPGTQGSFDIKLKNESEVTAKYTITYTADTNNIPLEFSKDGLDWSSDISDVTSTDKLAMGAEASTATIYWRWAFERGTESTEKENNNTADTALGTASTAPTVTVTAHLVAEQED